MKLLIAGGGTAGHINPGLAVAKQIKLHLPGTQILFVGTRRGMEEKLVSRDGFEIQFISVRGFQRKITFKNLLAVKDLFSGMFESKRILSQFRPDVVLGTGGYVCGPVVLNARLMGIPAVIHEQNAFPGITNKILSIFVNKIAISFEESQKYFFNKKNIYYTGNPVREEILRADRENSRKLLNIRKGERLVVIFGGSLGADRINQCVVDMINKSYNNRDFRLIFATGNSRYERIKGQIKIKETEALQIMPYIYNMAEIMTAADLVVCRAGAITLSELTAAGIPSIIIPSPNVTANHQEYNARALEKHNAAVVITEKQLNEEMLYKNIIKLVKQGNRLKAMSINAKKIGKSDAAEKIVSLISDITL